MLEGSKCFVSKGLWVGGGIRAPSILSGNCLKLKIRILSRKMLYFNKVYGLCLLGIKFSHFILKQGHLYESKVCICGKTWALIIEWSMHIWGSALSQKHLRNQAKTTRHNRLDDWIYQLVEDYQQAPKSTPIWERSLGWNAQTIARSREDWSPGAEQVVGGWKKRLWCQLLFSSTPASIIIHSLWFFLSLYCRLLLRFNACVTWISGRIDD